MADIPDDLVLVILKELVATELVAVSEVSRRFRELSNTEDLWRDAFTERWGEPTTLAEKAKTITGSWKGLYGSKDRAERVAAPWAVPADEETAAMVHDMCDGVYRSTQDGKLQLTQDHEVVFLLDGSGSVTDDDFSTMTTFLGRAGATILSRTPHAKLGIVQFASDARVERRLIDPVDHASWAAAVAALQRVNGGTNIAASIRKAGKMFARDLDEPAAPAVHPSSFHHAALPPPPPPAPASTQTTDAEEDECVARTVVLLTDGRTDAFQSRDAVACAARLMDETANCEIFTLGVGRGVDADALSRIAAAAHTKGTPAYADAAARYMPLRVLHDNDDEW